MERWGLWKVLEYSIEKCRPKSGKITYAFWKDYPRRLDLKCVCRLEKEITGVIERKDNWENVCH